MSSSLWLSVVITVVIATIFTVAPALETSWKPALLAMAVIFWSLYYPQQISLGIAFLCGLWLDALIGTLMGSHALSLIVISYVTTLMHQRLRMFTWLQLVVFVFIIVGLGQILLNWTFAIRGSVPAGLSYLQPALSSALIWPVWQFVLRLIHPEREMLSG